MEYRYHVVLIPAEEGGYVVDVPALPSCHTEGDTLEEALIMAKDAIQLYIDYLISENKPVPSSDITQPIVDTIKIVA